MKNKIKNNMLLIEINSDPKNYDAALKTLKERRPEEAVIVVKDPNKKFSEKTYFNNGETVAKITTVKRLRDMEISVTFAGKTTPEILKKEDDGEYSLYYRKGDHQHNIGEITFMRIQWLLDNLTAKAIDGVKKAFASKDQSAFEYSVELLFSDSYRFMGPINKIKAKIIGTAIQTRKKLSAGKMNLER